MSVVSIYALQPQGVVPAVGFRIGEQVAHRVVSEETGIVRAIDWAGGETGEEEWVAEVYVAEPRWDQVTGYVVVDETVVSDETAVEVEVKRGPGRPKKVA